MPIPTDAPPGSFPDVAGERRAIDASGARVGSAKRRTKRLNCRIWRRERRQGTHSTRWVRRATRSSRPRSRSIHLDLDLAGATPTKKTPTLRLLARAPEAAGRALLVAVALTQDRKSTTVPSGENAGRTLVEHHVVRRLDHKFTRLDRTRPTTLTFPIELPQGANPGPFHVVAVAQDRAIGRVHQADAVPWTPAPAAGKTAGR